MTKINRLEKRLKEYQKKHQKLLKADKAAGSRYGDEYRDIQLRVLESAMVQIKLELVGLKKKNVA